MNGRVQVGCSQWPLSRNTIPENITDGVYRDIIMYRLHDYHRKIKNTLITHVCLISQHYERHCNSYNAAIVVTAFVVYC